MQASSLNVNDILKIKNIFPSLSSKKINKIHKVVNNYEKTRRKMNII